MTKKHCKYCDQMLERSSFTVRAASPDGLSYKCRECASKYAKARYGGNVSVAEAAKQRAKKWAQANPEKRLDVSRRYTQLHLDAERHRKRVYGVRARHLNPEAAKAKGRYAIAVRRLRVALAMAKPHKAVMARLVAKANGRCTYCLGLFTSLTVDHFVPVVHKGNGQIPNLIPCCKPCNASKGAKDGADWIAERFGQNRLVDVLRALPSLSAARLP
jgi:5-methylcytosine-specific restriction endonuclease McrA